MSNGVLCDKSSIVVVSWVNGTRFLFKQFDFYEISNEILGIFVKVYDIPKQWFTSRDVGLDSELI